MSFDWQVGALTIKGRRYFIEPLEGHEPNEEGHHLHVVYRRDTPEEFEDFDFLFAGKAVGSEKKCRNPGKSEDEVFGTIHPPLKTIFIANIIVWFQEWE